MSVFDLFKNLKERARRVRKTRWDFRIVEKVWEHRVWHVKACTYYWVLLPSAIIVTGLFYLLAGAIYGGGAFFGYLPRKENEYHRDDRIFLPRGTLPGGRRWPVYFQPWFIILVTGTILWAIRFPETFMLIVWFVLRALLVLGVLGGILYALGKTWKSPGVRGSRRVIRGLISAAWDKVCPSLVIEQNGDNRPYDWD